MSAGSRASFSPDGFMNLRFGVASLDFRRYREQGRPKLTEPPTTLPCTSASDLSDLEVKFTNSRAHRFISLPGSFENDVYWRRLRPGWSPPKDKGSLKRAHRTRFQPITVSYLLPCTSFTSSKVRVPRGRLHPAKDCSILRHRSERSGGRPIQAPFLQRF